jgi:hypothetical protein
MRKKRLQEVFDVLDPVRLLAKIRLAQQQIANLEVGRREGNASEKIQDLDAFLHSLRTLWRYGEVRPTHRKRFEGPWPATGSVRNGLASRRGMAQ